MDDADRYYMKRALELAKRAWGNTAPNPMVGAVLVKYGKIIGEGYHTRDGAPHAEIECLRSAKESPEGATIYVTLEPCSTHGRTGACTEAIIKAKIASVKIGTLDPNPAHAGRATEIFKKNSILCETGILKDECEKLNFIFNYSIVNAKALLALKYAMSSDGKIASAHGVQTRITQEAALADVMKWRKLFGAIGVGSNTVLSDDPALTARIEGNTYCAQRLVFDASLRLADVPDIKTKKVFCDEFKNRTRIVCDALADDKKQKNLQASGIAVMRIYAPKSNAAAFWNELKERLYKERITSLYVEGGAKVIGSVCQARAADYAFEYVNPKLVLGDTALGAFDYTAQKQRPFCIEAKKETLGVDTITCGKVIFQ